MSYNKPVPRTCGDEPRKREKGERGKGLFPARAGMNPTTTLAARPWLPVPRTCGDEPGTPGQKRRGNHCSPHVRG